MANFILRSLRGSNLEIFKFAMYLSFPIGWMYYFGTNLESRFSVPDFWPTAEQSHKIPYERAEIKAEVERMTRELKERKMRAVQQQPAQPLPQEELVDLKAAFRRVGDAERSGS